MLLIFLVIALFAQNVQGSEKMKEIQKYGNQPKFDLLAFNVPPQLVKRANTPSTPQIPHLSATTDKVLERLGACESGNSPDKVILDTNGLYSYGLLQFQLKTFMSYGVKYGILPATITTQEARNLIMFPKIQKELAGRMLKDGFGYHWANCMKIISLK